MSKKIKSLVQNEIGKRIKGVEGLAVLNPSGLDGIKTNKLRRQLSEKGMKMLVVKNSLVKRAVASTGSKLVGFESLLSGASALVFGDKVEVSAIARVLVDAKKENDKLQLRGVFFDGEVFAGEKGVEMVSKFPTRTEAIGDILSALLGPASSIAGALNQGGMIASLVDAVEQKGANG
jgi:large subunit ribosomal protein L10